MAVFSSASFDGLESLATLNEGVDLVPDHSDKPEEACGVFGIYAPGIEVAKLTYFGLFALQHRGQESAGIATFVGDKVSLHKDMGLVTQVFDEDILNTLPGSIPATPPLVLAVW
jgi:amidophosphoribosyltransferase